MILVAGGAGYIGSHTCLELLKAGYEVIVFDNFSNSYIESIRRLERITKKNIPVIDNDIRNEAAVELALRQYNCEAVIHFAGLKAVGESVKEPLLYYENNVGGTFSLLRAMKAADVKTIVFSSSATVYGEPQKSSLSEDHPLSCTNPYGRTKLMIEDILRDLYRAEAGWRVGILRYFNPVGAHESGLIGEDPRGTPNNLMPIIAQVAIGRMQKLNIWGNDYSTRDGTGVRDYVHVVDLAIGHLKTLEYLKEPQCLTVNLGTGAGYSVLDVINAFEKASGRKIAYEFAPRRSGDVAECYANPELAERQLGWKAERDIATMCEDHWRWQINNPEGYLSLDFA